MNQSDKAKLQAFKALGVDIEKFWSGSSRTARKGKSMLTYKQKDDLESLLDSLISTISDLNKWAKRRGIAPAVEGHHMTDEQINPPGQPKQKAYDEDPFAWIENFIDEPVSTPAADEEVSERPRRPPSFNGYDMQHLEDFLADAV